MLRRLALGDDRGSAVVEFVLIAPLLLFVALAVVQMALLMHVRASLVSAAAEGARAGSLAGADPAVGVTRAREIAERNSHSAVIDDVVATRESIDGLSVLTVRIDAEVPLLTVLGSTRLEVEAHALIEGVR